MTKTSRPPRRHRPTLGQIARSLPEAGSKEARLLRHVLQCEICTDAALSILEIGNRVPRKTPNYDSAFAAAADRAIRLFERRLRAEPQTTNPTPDLRRWNGDRLMGRAGDREEGKKQGKEKAREPGAAISEAFRETFLFLFSPEDAEVFRRFVEVVQDRLLERSTYEERNPHFSYTLAEMLAVAADLSYLKTFLQGVAAERRLSDLTPTEHSLSQLAERFALEVAALAERLELEIKGLVSDDEEEQVEARRENGQR